MVRVILEIKPQNLVIILVNGLYSITLWEDSYLCSACYTDCTRKAGKPRWYQYSKNSVLKHCTLCCDPSATCKCEEIVDWGPQNWFDGENIEHWWMYFTINDYKLNKACGSVLCKKHYSLM